MSFYDDCRLRRGGGGIIYSVRKYPNRMRLPTLYVYNYAATRV